MRSAIRTSKIFRVTELLDPSLEIARFASLWRKRYGDGHILQFDNVKGHPELSIVLDLAQRRQILTSLGLHSENWLAEASHRLMAEAPEPHVVASLATTSIDGFGGLPIMVHQPKDKGRYITSAVTVVVDPETGIHNLGCYRIYICGERRCTIFMDPHTDAHAIVEKHRRNGTTKIPVTLFLGGPLGALFSGAAAISRNLDSYAFLGQLSEQSVALDDGLGGAFPAAPSDAEIVIRGYLCEEREWEGPFGEFKGYYSEPTLSPVFEVADIRCRPDATFLGLLCGKRSGLTLMSMQNELLMYHRLTQAGFSIEDVANPLDAYGEYLCVIRTKSPHAALLEAAMAADQRAKMFIIGDELNEPLAQISKSPIDVRSEVYMRRGKPEGRRFGIQVHPKEDINPVAW